MYEFSLGFFKFTITEEYFNKNIFRQTVSGYFIQKKKLK